jgi:sporulation protein YlmC with PRC-barrel domain
MALKTRKVTQSYDMRVFTDDGYYFGDIEEATISSNKVMGWRIKATKNSYLTKVLGGAKGVIVPHQLVRAIGDVFVISKSAIPSSASEETDSSEEE